MNSLTHSLPAKIAAVFLITIIFVVTTIAALITAFMAYSGGYTGSINDVRDDIIDSYITAYAQEVSDCYFSGDDPLSEYNESNYYFTIDDADGNKLTSNYSGQAAQYKASIACGVGYDGAYYTDEGLHKYIPAVVYNVTIYLKTEFTETDRLSTALYWLDTAYSLRYAAVILTLIGILTFFVLLVFLLCSAGHRKGAEGAVLNTADKIPFDIYTAFFMLLAYIELRLLDGIYGDFSSYVFLALIGIVDFLLLLGYIMSFATRVKTGSFFKNTLIFMLLRIIWICVSRAAKGIAYIFMNLPLVWKTALIICGLSLTELIFIVVCRWDTDVLVFWWFIEKLLTVPLIMLAAISFRKLQKGGMLIAAGDLGYKVDTRHMPWDFRRFGETLNGIRSGMSRTVDERMKSERMKTELITNVSHDIKTPLTSIINYVDLIKKEEISGETMRSYVEVLDRQSAKLKKLIEDLVEASKASSGSLAVNMSPCEIGVLLAQTAGEYQEKLNDRCLELILTQPEAPVRIMADGRHLWRIFDKLMSNVCKYSQPSTRVYLSLEIIDGKAVITFRNISNAPLNISSEELMERFVRGDSSRSTEGSGLGLSIARSLTTLQNGTLDVCIDGDLFKAILTFNIIV